MLKFMALLRRKNLEIGHGKAEYVSGEGRGRRNGTLRFDRIANFRFELCLTKGEFHSGL
jgi:hypothetical protein